MCDDHKQSSPVAQKLRVMGFVTLPRWWVTPAELEIIHRIAKHHLPTVMAIKEQIRTEQELDEYGRSSHGWHDYRPE
jgi:hypothetical protein